MKRSPQRPLSPGGEGARRADEGMTALFFESNSAPGSPSRRGGDARRAGEGERSAHNRK